MTHDDGLTPEQYADRIADILEHHYWQKQNISALYGDRQPLNDMIARLDRLVDRAMLTHEDDVERARR